MSWLKLKRKKKMEREYQSEIMIMISNTQLNRVSCRNKVKKVSGNKSQFNQFNESCANSPHTRKYDKEELMSVTLNKIAHYTAAAAAAVVFSPFLPTSNTITLFL